MVIKCISVEANLTLIESYGLEKHSLQSKYFNVMRQSGGQIGGKRNLMTTRRRSLLRSWRTPILHFFGLKNFKPKYITTFSSPLQCIQLKLVVPYAWQSSHLTTNFHIYHNVLSLHWRISQISEGFRLVSIVTKKVLKHTQMSKLWLKRAIFGSLRTINLGMFFLGWVMYSIVLNVTYLKVDFTLLLQRYDSGRWITFLNSAK